MPGQSPISGVTHDNVELCLAVCRLHELLEEHVWKIRMLFILNILSRVVISHICFTNVGSTCLGYTEADRVSDLKVFDQISI